MAVFGIPVLHEDDALRAVRAASEMRERLAALNEELERDWGVTIAVRTGVNTGEVVAGDGSEGQRFATGDAVNVAKRFEEAAPPGEVLLGETTYRLVRDAVEVEPTEPLGLKGKSEAVRAYRLVTLAGNLPGRARRLDSPMVGRERELAALEQAYQRAVGERACLLFTVLGAAGVGKSRLIAEFLAGVGGEATVMRGRCLPYGEGITYWPLAEALRGRYGEEPLAGIGARSVRRRSTADHGADRRRDRPRRELPERRTKRPGRSAASSRPKAGPARSSSSSTTCSGPSPRSSTSSSIWPTGLAKRRSCSSASRVPSSSTSGRAGAAGSSTPPRCSSNG